MSRVALYYPWIYLKSGIERTIVEVVRRSRHDITVYTSHFDPQGTYADFSGIPVHIVGEVSVRRTYLEAGKAALRMLTLRFDPAKTDALVICCDGLGPLLGFRNGNLPLLNLCFTPLRAVYDMEYRKRLMDRGGWRFAKLLAEKAFRIVDRLAWQRFDSVICNSRTTRDRVTAGGLRAAQDLIVAYPGVAASSIREQGPMGDFFFLPGRIMWTKNIELAIDAYALYRERGGTLRLVIAGMVDNKSQGYFNDLKERAQGIPDIAFETVVSDARMRDLYENCRAVLLASFNEDQGLTPLEGMACGKPSIAVNRGGPRESVVDGVNGFLVEPDPESFAAPMFRLEREEGLAARMGREGLTHVTNFTWERFMDVFDAEIDRIIVKRQARDSRQAPASGAVPSPADDRP
ncbi:MAG: glycosyltransferase [Pseudochelatococcus sp.]|jgi:glycosyltransferase involved in cell wall biosynthesis|uniref:glycosyltransferase n=1 Tax=Pseudochelatococcus sp. TaxID=2020869 RepID=UPI003D939D44